MFRRHCYAITAGLVLVWIIWTIQYIQTYTGSNPIAQADPGRYAIGGSVALVEGLIVGLGIFAPASLLGSTLCFLWNWPRIATTPVVFSIAALLGYFWYSLFVETLTTSSMISTSSVLKNFTIYLSIPLFAYWWLTSYRVRQEKPAPTTHLFSN